MKKNVCVDLDGVLAQYDRWKGIEHIGDPHARAAAIAYAVSIQEENSQFSRDIMERVKVSL